VPAESRGITTDGKWDTLGMRGTYSPTVTFTNVRIDRDATLGEPGAALQAGVVEVFGLGYAAVYIGIAESAVAFAPSARWANCPAALWAVGACVVVVVVLPSGSAVTGFGFRTVIHAAMKATAQIRTIRMGGEIWDIAHPPSAFRSVV